MAGSGLDKVLIERTKALFPRKAVKLYLKGKFEKCCEALTEGYSYSDLPFTNRVLLGLCMVNGRLVEYGFHHLSMALEIAPLSFRCLPELFLGQAYSACGFINIALELYTDENIVKLERLLEENDRNAVNQVPKVRIGSKPINPKYTLKNQVLDLNEAVNRVVPEDLEEYRDFSKARNLDRLTNTICRLSPVTDALSLFFKADEKPEFVLSRYLQSFAAIDSNKSPETVVFYILTLDNKFERYSEFVRWWFITTTSTFLTAKDEKNHKKYQWLIRVHEAALLSDLIRFYDEPNLKIIMKCASLFCARASLLYEELNMDKIDTLISDILNCSINLDPKLEHINGRSEYFFSTMSLLYQRKSILSLEKIDENNYVFPKNNLEQSMRNLIILTTIIPIDNTLISRIYDEILVCIILHGQLHMKTIWFFNYLRNYFALTNGLTHSIDCDYYTKLSNFNKLIGRIKKFVSSMKKGQKLYEKESKIRDLDNEIYSPGFMIPKVHVISSEHELIDIRFPKDYKTINDSQMVDEFNTKSNELMRLWIDSFLDYNDSLPKDIYKYLKRLNIPV